jgi:riboflavin-specific deaminase-like protein
MTPIEAWLAEAADHRLRFGRPLVSLCYAQSLDGSLSERRGQSLELSGVESRALTHRLRSLHDAILVGIGTVLSDDPSLSVRYAQGNQPQPIILDSRLRFPLTARMLQTNPRKPQLVVTDLVPPERITSFEQAGLSVIQLPASPEGHVPLAQLLEQLAARGISSVMVEGGASILSSFLRLGLADLLCVTIAPRYVGGLNVIDPPGSGMKFPKINDVHYQCLGEDLILYGRLNHEN